jgi:hypothetical protein
MGASVRLYEFFVFVGVHFLTRSAFSVFLELFVEHLKGLVHVGAGEAGSDAAACINGNESIVVPSFHVAGHPVTPLGEVHAPELALPGKVLHFHKLYLREGNGLGVGEGEEVALDFDVLVGYSYVFVLVHDQAHWEIACDGNYYAWVLIKYLTNKAGSSKKSDNFGSLEPGFSGANRQQEFFTLP